LDRWLARKNLQSGYAMPIQQCWQLARKWYTGRLERDWQRPSLQDAQLLFESLGLTGDFWDLGANK
jgi:hypothetical protein